MASDILNRVGMVITTTGQGAVTANVPISNRFNTPAEAGAVNAKSYWWMLEEGNDYEIFEGTWTLSGTSILRDTVAMSKIADVKGTTKMTLAGNATLRSITPAEVFQTVAPYDAMQSANIIGYCGACEVAQERGNALFQQLVSGVEVYVVDGITAKMSRAGTLAIAFGTNNAANFGSNSPPGFQKCVFLQATTPLASLATNDYAYLSIPIEGYRVSRLDFGKASASYMTIGFWVFATATGTYSAVLQNGAANRANPVTYTVNVASTWEYKVVTLLCDQTGTWDVANGLGLRLIFAMLAGSGRVATANAWNSTDAAGASGQVNGGAASGGTLAITGVSVLPGRDAPPAARSQNLFLSFDKALFECQRYYEKSYDYASLPTSNSSNGLIVWSQASNSIAAFQPYLVAQLVKKRSLATVSIIGVNGTVGSVSRYSDFGDIGAGSGQANNIGQSAFTARCNGSGATTGGNAVVYHWVADNRF